MFIAYSSYRELAEEVYNVEPSKAKSNNKKVVFEGRTLKDRETGQTYQVLITQDNNASLSPNPNGMQAMAVAPIIEGKVDTSQIVVAYAGTNQKDEHDIDTDIQMVIGGNTKTLITDGILADGNFRIYTTYTDSQLKTAQQFYTAVKKAYPHAQLTTTGHSLGAYIALIVAAENKVPATTFNGPDPIRGMSDTAVKWVKANNHLYNNFRIKGDIIGNFGAYYADNLGTDALGISRLVEGRKGTGKHSLNAYRFNKSGQIVTDKGAVVDNSYLVSGAYQATLKSKQDMRHFQDLKKQWEQTGGVISSDEAIFLDLAQAHPNDMQAMAVA